MLVKICHLHSASTGNGRINAKSAADLKYASTGDRRQSAKTAADLEFASTGNRRHNAKSAADLLYAKLLSVKHVEFLSTKDIAFRAVYKYAPIFPSLETTRLKSATL